MDYRHYDLIKKPVITEKANILSEQNNKFTFEVLSSANKKSVKLAIEKIFEVKVDKVNIMNVKGKKRVYKGVVGIRSDRKKAIVTLSNGFAINFTGGVN